MIYGNVRGYANSKWTYSWLSALRRLKLARMPQTPPKKLPIYAGESGSFIGGALRSADGWRFE